ncbi:MAG TPA: protein kinase [Candidatus Acidoferrales bacterium]|nr:protein kinase [Candidatus Acidoferrales bacterium]
MSTQSTPPEAAAARNLIGKTVGRFAVDARLGAGGMGEVYRARDTKLRRVVALKRVAAHLCANENSRERLWKEALCASRLNDPHIAAIHDAFEDRGEIFLVMEYVEGQSLRDRMREPITVPQFLAIAIQCAAGLDAAHRGGIQHRDIKPENILLTRKEQVKILDFGIARRLPGDTEGTTVDSLASDGFIGTVIYMAPEVMEQWPSDNRADIFSLGVVFYEALTGHHPFRGATFFDTCQRILKHMPAPVGKTNAEVPQKLDAIIVRMLAKRPADRYASAADVLADLQEVQTQLDATHRTITALPPAKTNALVVRGFWIGGAFVVLALSGFFVYKHFQKPVLTEQAPILITDFENRTGNAVFNQTVTEAVRESLEQSHYFRVIPRSQVYETARLMGRPSLAHVDRALGREICERDNCRAVLAGSVVETGARYEITEELVDPAKDTSVLVDTASMNSPADLYSTIDSLTQQIRKGAGESLAQISRSSQPLSQVTTSSLEALQRYSQGLDLYAADDLEGFLPLGESAVALDPNFAMAHLYLYRAYDTLGNEKAAQQHLAAAMRGLNHVTERERYLILAVDFEGQEDYEKAADEYRLLTEVYPDDIQGFSGLAAMSIWTGRFEEAVPAERHILEMKPHSAVDHENLILDLDRLNRFDEALSAYSAARKAGVESPFLRWGSGLAYLGKGDTTAATREFHLLGSEGGEDGENLASFYTARILMYQGRLQSAADELRKGLMLDEKMHSEGYMPVRRYLLAQIALIHGDNSVALEEAGRMARDALRAPQSVDLRRAGEVLIHTNELPATQKVLRSLAELRDQHKSEFMQSCYYNLKGMLELAQHQPDASIDSQEKAAVFFPLYNAYLDLGDALATKHDWSGAAQAYKKYLNFEGEILQDDSPSSWVLAHLTLARMLAREGKTAEAQKYYDQFLQLWANADGDLAPLRQARAERMQLSKTKQFGLNRPGTAGDK